MSKKEIRKIARELNQKWFIDSKDFDILNFIFPEKETSCRQFGYEIHSRQNRKIYTITGEWSLPDYKLGVYNFKKIEFPLHTINTNHYFVALDINPNRPISEFKGMLEKLEEITIDPDKYEIWATKELLMLYSIVIPFLSSFALKPDTHLRPYIIALGLTLFYGSKRFAESKFQYFGTKELPNELTELLYGDFVSSRLKKEIELVNTESVKKEMLIETGGTPEEVNRMFSYLKKTYEYRRGSATGNNYWFIKKIIDDFNSITSTGKVKQYLDIFEKGRKNPPLELLLEK